MSFPVVVSNLAIALSVALAGQTTSHVVIFPLPSSEVEFTVFMFVADTSVSCFALIAVCVAVDTGNSARVQSFGLFESETSAIKIISQLAGVTPVVSVGKSRLLMLLKLRDYSTIPDCTS